MSRQVLTTVVAAIVFGLSSSSSMAGFSLNLGQGQIENAAFGPNASAIQMTFENDGVGAVKLSISNNTSNGSIYDVHIKRIVFNLADLFWAVGAPTWSSGLGFEYLSGESDIAAQSIKVKHDENTIEVNPERYFDIELAFEPGFSNGFVSGMTSVYRITSDVAGFGANAFKSVNLQGPNPNDNSDQFYAGVHYGYKGDNIGSGKSGALNDFDFPEGGISGDPVPVPSSVLGLIAAGLGLFIFRGRISVG